jgi:hypothetical protein
MAMLGLSIDGELPEKGVHAYLRINGAYRRQMHGDYATFFALEGEDVRELSNGEYTLGIVTRDADGLRTMHTLNPNCRRRPVYHYRESSDLHDKGLFAANARFS